MRAIVVLLSSLLGVFLGVPLAAQSPVYELSISDGEGAPGSDVLLNITFDTSGGGSLNGWSFGACHDTSALTLEVDGVDTSGQDTFGLDWLLYTLTYHDVGGVVEGFTVGGVLNPITLYVLEPGVYDEFYEMTYTIDGDATGTTTVEWCDTLGVPPVGVVVVPGALEVDPATNDGTVTVVSESFRRGNVDGNGATAALLDSLFLLDWAFLGGPTRLDLVVP